MSQDEFEHFLEAQEPVYAEVVAELTAGQERSHWMWFIFPQLLGLGRSELARRFALRSLDEARRYVQHHELGPSANAPGLVNAIPNRGISEIFGDPDDLKFHSSMTLFAAASPGDSVFQAALGKFFSGRNDSQTIERLSTVSR